MDKTSKAPGVQVRAVMRGALRASLATTLARYGDSQPYVSLTLAAVDHDASPLLVLSDLADHTYNIQADPRIALLFDGTLCQPDPLAGARATILGRAVKVDQPRLLARYIARHPGAGAYAGFADVHLYRVEVARAHLVAGFGSIHWLTADDVLFDARACAPLAEAEPDIVAHMNQDHGKALRLIAGHVLGLPGADWVMTGIDPEGCDLRGNGAAARVGFDRAVGDASGARAALVALAKRARLAAADALP